MDMEPVLGKLGQGGDVPCSCKGFEDQHVHV